MTIYDLDMSKLWRCELYLDRALDVVCGTAWVNVQTASQASALIDLELLYNDLILYQGELVPDPDAPDVASEHVAIFLLSCIRRSAT